MVTVFIATLFMERFTESNITYLWQLKRSLNNNIYNILSLPLNGQKREKLHFCHKLLKITKITKLNT